MRSTAGTELIRALDEDVLADRPMLRAVQLYGNRVGASRCRAQGIYLYSPTVSKAPPVRCHLVYFCGLLREETGASPRSKPSDPTVGGVDVVMRPLAIVPAEGSYHALRQRVQRGSTPETRVPTAIFTLADSYVPDVNKLRISDKEVGG